MVGPDLLNSPAPAFPNGGGSRPAAALLEVLARGAMETGHRDELLAFDALLIGSRARMRGLVAHDVAAKVVEMKTGNGFPGLLQSLEVYHPAQAVRTGELYFSSGHSNPSSRACCRWSSIHRWPSKLTGIQKGSYRSSMPRRP